MQMNNVYLWGEILHLCPRDTQRAISNNYSGFHTISHNIRDQVEKQQFPFNEASSLSQVSDLATVMNGDKNAKLYNTTQLGRKDSLRFKETLKNDTNMDCRGEQCCVWIQRPFIPTT